MAVATAPSVTPAHATRASSSMSPEHALRPLPPVAGCNPAAVSALPVWTLHVRPSPSVPLAFSVMTAASGAARYFAFRGACSSLSCWVFMRKSYPGTAVAPAMTHGAGTVPAEPDTTPAARPRDPACRHRTAARALHPSAGGTHAHFREGLLGCRAAAGRTRIRHDHTPRGTWTVR